MISNPCIWRFNDWLKNLTRRVWRSARISKVRSPAQLQVRNIQFKKIAVMRFLSPPSPKKKRVHVKHLWVDHDFLGFQNAMKPSGRSRPPGGWIMKPPEGKRNARTWQCRIPSCWINCLIRWNPRCPKQGLEVGEGSWHNWNFRGSEFFCCTCVARFFFDTVVGSMLQHLLDLSCTHIVLDIGDIGSTGFRFCYGLCCNKIPAVFRISGHNLHLSQDLLAGGWRPFGECPWFFTSVGWNLEIPRRPAAGFGGGNVTGGAIHFTSQHLPDISQRLGFIIFSCWKKWVQTGCGGLFCQDTSWISTENVARESLWSLK